MLLSDVDTPRDFRGSDEMAGTATATATATASVMPRVKIETGALTHPGKVRKNNEDHFAVARLAKSMHVHQTSLPDSGTRFSDEDGYLLVVADGMGGAAAGEIASARAVEAVEEFALDRLKWFFHSGRNDENALAAELRKSLEKADRAVLKCAEEDYRLAGMGTTLTMAYSVGRDLFIVHAGDSRAYLYRGGKLEQITNDHTLVQLMVSGGIVSAEDARHHARRNVVTNVVGGPSAGVHAEIAEVLAKVADPEVAARRLVELAIHHGGPDNVTAIVARYTIAD